MPFDFDKNRSRLDLPLSCAPANGMAHTLSRRRIGIHPLVLGKYFYAFKFDSVCRELSR